MFQFDWGLLRIVAGISLLGGVRNGGRISRGNDCITETAFQVLSDFFFSRYYFMLRGHTVFVDPTVYNNRVVLLLIDRIHYKAK